MKKGQVICGFPGTGKRWAIQRLKDMCDIVYVDDIEFKWIGTILRDFGLRYPKVFVNQIKKLQETHDFIMVSSDREVRDVLNAYHIEYHIVYPNVMLKNEYIGRAYLNQYSDDYIKRLNDNWESIIKNCEHDETPHKYELSQHEYIGNYILKLIAESDMNESEKSEAN